MYPPHHFGGYELVWRAAMRELESRGHEVLILTGDLDTGASEADDPNVRRELGLYWRPHEVPPLGPLARLRHERRNARVLDRHLEAFWPDVVSWWSMAGMSLSLMERVRRAGIPAIAFVHDDWLGYAREMDLWLRAFEGRWRPLASIAELVTRVPTRVDLARVARCVFVSETTRRRAAEAGVTPASSGIAHSGIDPGFIDPAPAREWSWSLLYVGRLDQRKGVDTAVAALAHLPDAATLTIIGGWDEHEEERLRVLARGVGVEERVRFAGQRTRAAVRAAYADCDVVVFPVVWEEPWGLVPLEGMARGRPVVATGRGGSGEYLRDGENALLFEAGSEAALADAVRRLAGDPGLRRRLLAGGLETASRHTEDAFNAAVLQELARAATGSGTSSAHSTRAGRSPAA
jgi:glycosyltransferase involved in cell wall biosynthesis